MHADSRACAADRARHAFFILQKSAAALVALAGAPFILAFSSTSAPAALLALACVAGLVAAAARLSRHGRLREAQGVAALAWLGLATFGAFGAVLPREVALAALALAPLETMLVGAPLLSLGAGIASAALASLIVALVPAAAFGAGHAIGLALLALYAGAHAVFAARLADMGVRDDMAAAATYRLLARTIGDVVLRLGPGGNVLAVSDEATAGFALAARDMLGRGLFERIHVGDRPAFLKAVADAEQGRSGVHATVTACVRMRNGAVASSHDDFDEPTFATVEMRVSAAAPGADGSGGRACVAVLRDVTDLRRHEADLEAARAEAVRASAWKDRFLANVSHELRTPLNAIIGFSEMLGNPDLAPKDPLKQREYARIINSSGEHLLAVVNTILDMSKIEAGSFEIEPEPFDMAPMIDACCDMMRLKAEQGGITLTRVLPKGLEEIVADKRACKQVVINLLSNAIKFTPKGGEVSVSVQPEGNSLVVAVADTGIGILRDDLGRVGDPFFQARATYDRPYEGTGLGLSVVRGLVGLHGGTIRIESAPGEGTRVVIRLPLDCRVVKPVQGQGARIETLARRVPAPSKSTSPQVKKSA